MTTSIENFVISNGARIWCAQSGQGLPIILCSGGPGCCDYLEPVAQMLNDVAQIIRFEQRGCGRSDVASLYDIETCLTDLESIRKYYDIDCWIVGGHSWGADLALFYALEHSSRVAGLICISGGRVHNDRQWHDEYKRREAEEGEYIPEFAYPVNREVNEQVNRSWKSYIQQPDLLSKIANLRVPALFIYGERDIRPSWPTEQIAKLMPNARFELIPGAEHVIWSTHAAELRARLREFVARVTNH